MEVADTTAKDRLLNSTAVPSTNSGETVASPDTTTTYATVQKVAQDTGLSRSTIYLELSRGNLRGKKLGTRTLIDVQHAQAWLRSLPEAVIRPHGRDVKRPSAPGNIAA